MSTNPRDLLVKILLPRQYQHQIRQCIAVMRAAKGLHLEGARAEAGQHCGIVQSARSTMPDGRCTTPPKDDL